MKAPDTSPRWDRSSWQIDATRRALRTAARDGTPGRGGAERSRRCRKKGLYMLLDRQFGLRQVRCWDCIPSYATDIKKPSPKGFGGGPVGIPSRRFALETGSG